MSELGEGDGVVGIEVMIGRGGVRVREVDVSLETDRKVTVSV